MALHLPSQGQEQTQISTPPAIPGSITVVGMLGRPGSGKGTQCQLLSQKLKIGHISVGTVLRAEMLRPGSEHAAIIRENMETGRVGPKEITVGVLRSHIIAAAQHGTENFVLDGFPRRLDQAEYFEEMICPIQLIIVLECSEDKCTQRLLPRARFDDTYENIQRRLDTFVNTTGKVIDQFSDRGSVKRVNAEMEIDAVNKELEQIFANIGGIHVIENNELKG